MTKAYTAAVFYFVCMLWRDKTHLQTRRLIFGSACIRLCLKKKRKTQMPTTQREKQAIWNRAHQLDGAKEAKCRISDSISPINTATKAAIWRCIHDAWELHTCKIDKQTSSLWIHRLSEWHIILSVLLWICLSFFFGLHLIVLNFVFRPKNKHWG